ncbi:MAG: dTDP-4-dehydrorhamnose 3,5-epimerase [Balneolia bacterium]|nr:dTDP-4-dehydrorhamnose 3,5-epimerase [Balneolia bacterium]
MKIIETEIPGLFIIEPKIYGDERGFFTETFRKSWLTELGLDYEFVQDNWSRSGSGILRGLHYQISNPQAKLVMVSRGEVLDVAVDIRKGSPTYGKHEAITLSEENKRMVFIPEGLAHGFLVKSDVADFRYKCSNYYDPSGERALFWNDPALDINWDIENPVVSAKDNEAPVLSDIPEADLPLYPKS